MEATNPNSGEAGQKVPGFGSRPWVIALLLGLLTSIAFLPIWRADFLSYGDSLYATENPNVQQGFNLDVMRWAFSSGDANIWHPVTWISHMLDWKLFGGATGPHAVNLVLHIINAVVLFALLRKMTGTIWRSAFVAGLFAIHPVQVESVAWVTSRKDVLSTFFALLSLSAYVRYVSALPAETSKRVFLYCAAVCLFALGLLSKPTLIVLPFVLLLLDYWPLRRAGGVVGTICARDWTTLLIEKVPFISLAVVTGIITLVVPSPEAFVPFEKLSLLDRITTMFVSYARYVGKYLWPGGLAAHYPHPGSWPAWLICGSAMILVPLTWISIRLRHERPYLFVGWLWFVGTLFPVIGFVQFGWHSIADRYLYFPSIGLGILFLWLVSAVIERGRRQGSFLVLCASVGVLFISTLLTFRQTLMWTNGVRLFRHSLKVTPDNAFARNQLGIALALRGQMEEAQQHFHRAIELDSSDFFGEARNAKSAIEKTGGAVQRTAGTGPGTGSDSASSRGEALLYEGKYEEAGAQFVAALRADPSDIRAKTGYAHSLLAKKQYDEAVAAYREALKLAPDHRGANYGLATALVSLGKVDEALQQLKTARKDAGDIEVRSEFAGLLAEAGYFRHAADEYRDVLRLKPDSVNILNNLAWLLATCPEETVRDGKEAVGYAERACALTRFEIPVLIGTLAAAYAEAGNFAKAIEYAERARSLALSKGLPQIASKNAELLQLYRENRPFHEPPRNATNATVPKP